MGTVGAGEAVGAGAVTNARGGRGRRTRGGVFVSVRMDEGAHRAPKPKSTAGSATPVAAAVRRRFLVEIRPTGGKAAGGAGSPSGARQRRFLQSPCRPQRARQKPKLKRCRRLEKPFRGRDGDRWW